eukprot:g3202.t1
MLPDGSNPEGVDPERPPKWTSTKDFTNVVLYDKKYSPPCAKIRLHFELGDVPLEIHDGKKPDSDYKKVPSLSVAGQQVNDSFIIMKYIIPALYPDETFDAKWEKTITYGLQIEYLDEFKSALGTGPFLGGSSTPGAVDISFYGTLYMWNSVPFVQRSLKASGLDEWASKMESFRSSKKKRRGK